VLFFNYQLFRDLRDKNTASVLFQISDQKGVPENGRKTDAPGASPRRYGAPIAMMLYYQDPVTRYYRRIAGAPAPNRAGLAQGGHQSAGEISR